MDAEPENGIPSSVPVAELSKWCGLSYLDPKYLQNVKVAYLFNEVGALVTTEDEFYLVGRNDHGSLGTGSDTSYHSKLPTRIDSLCGKGVCDFAVAQQRKKDRSGPKRKTKTEVLSLFVLTREGSVYGWGFNDQGNLGLRHSSPQPFVPTKLIFPKDVQISQLACGAGHTLAVPVSNDGRIWGWGRNLYGQVGHGNRQDHTFPVPISLTITMDVRRQLKVEMVACGSEHSVALADDGSVYTWGHNDKGQLGIGTQVEFILSPKRIQFPDNSRIKKIASGKHHSLALSENGELFAWGSNHHGQLGNESKQKSRSPILVEMNHEVIDIAALSHHSITVCKTVEDIYMWGKLPEVNGKVVDQPWGTLMSSISDLFSSFCLPPVTHKPIVTNDMSHFYLNVSPELMKWSGLKYINPSILHNVKLAFVCGSGFEQTGILVTDEDEVLFVGRNVHGSFGTGIEAEFETRRPAKNLNLSGKGVCSFDFGLDVAGGCMCIFALTISGSVYSWGYNEYGELGHGDNTMEPARPKKIGGPLDKVKIKKLACGSDHTLAISEGGQLFSWGYNFYGQLGIDVVEDRPDPTQVTQFPRPNTQISSVAAGMFHSVAVTRDGHVYAWGRNDQGQLGGGLAAPYSRVPVFVRFPMSVSIEKIACGPHCTLALSTTGTLYFFGHCTFSENQAPEPVQVCTELGPEDPITDIGTAHWTSVYACQRNSGRVYVWGKIKGGKTQEHPRDEPRANSVLDVFAMFSNPPGMIRPLLCRNE